MLVKFNKKLCGGFAPFMFGVLLGITAVSIVTENNLRSRSSDYQTKYIQNKKNSIKHQAESYKYDVLQENSGTYISDVSAQLKTNIETNIFDNVNSVEISSNAGSIGAKKVLVTNDNNWNERNAHTSSTDSDSLTNIQSDSKAAYIDDESIRNLQKEISYNNMMKEVSTIYEDLIKLNKYTLPCAITNSKYTDAWGRNFTYSLIDNFHGTLSFNLPWDVGEIFYLKVNIPITTGAGGPGEIKDFVTGLDSLYVLSPSEEVWSVGENNYGQLAQGDNLDKNIWSNTGISNIKGVYSYKETAYALSNDGRLYGVGHGGSNQLGQGDRVNYNTWVDTGMSNVAQVYPGYRNVIVVLNDGTLRGIGSGGGLGVGVSGRIDAWQTITVPGAVGVSSISTGYQTSYLIDTTGRLFVTGRGVEGQLGLGNTDSQTYWVDTGITDVKQVITDPEYSSFNYAVALKNDGTLVVTGKNGDGQLGLGHNINQLSWIASTGITDPVEKIFLKYQTTFALTNKNELWVAGKNTNGQAGMSNTSDILNWTKHTSVTDVKDVQMGFYSTYVIENDGDLYVTGRNDLGQLGIGSFSDSLGFVLAGISDIKKVYTRGGYAYAVNNSNEVYSTGAADHGQLGDGSIINKETWFLNDISNNISDAPSCW